ncbi:hypothetical protein V9T40_003513 [Parthenolecanium corni]|uniref:Sodium channel protein Nach n=1 Tax=Parthenolecanium corni TaxID=536013 RepID=A0AAN9Y9S6_9HEMI
MKPVPNVPLPNFLDHKDMHANVWVAERFVSIGLLCSIPLVFADSSLEDLEAFVDILIALHVHWGLEAIFKDYLRPSVVGDTIPKFCDVYAGLVSIYLAVALLWISFYGTGVVKTIKHLWLLDPVTPSSSEVKFLWFGFVFIGLLITFVIMSSLWEKFQTSPTITGLDTDFHTWDVMFPSVTICAANPADSELIEQYISRHWDLNVNDTDYDFYEEFIQTVAKLSLTNLQDLNKYIEDETLNDVNLRSIMKKVMRNCQDWLHDCYFIGVQKNCCNIFSPVLTDAGFCYTFNSTYIDDDFINKTLPEVKIQYVYETDSDLAMIFDANDVEKNPIKVYLHSSSEKIISDDIPHLKWAKRIDTLLFSPKETYTTEDVRQLSIQQRHCVFPDEIPLMTDAIYSFGACLTECRMRISQRICDCVPIFYPEIGEYKHCTWSKTSCIIRHLDEIRNAEECQCELPCFNTVYEVEKLENAKKENLDDSLEIAFLTWPISRYKRDLLFGWVDLFVAFGGIAGSLLGFSVFSAVEILYFFTLRVFCMSYREKAKLEELHEEYKHKEDTTADLSLDPYTSCKELDVEIGKKKFTYSDSHLPYLP